MAGVAGMTAEGVGGAARLAFLAGVSEHVAGCRRCAAGGLDRGGTGAEWLSWGVGADPVMRAVWVAVAGRGGAAGLKLPQALAGRAAVNNGTEKRIGVGTWK
jgi:hypothetical protein